MASNAKETKVDASESELRRPVKKTSVISNEVLNKIRELYDLYLQVFIKASRFRGLRIQRDFDEFIAKYFNQDEGSDASTRLSNTLSLYCQSFDDPYLTSMLWEDEDIKQANIRFPGLERVLVSYDNLAVTLGSISHYLGLRDAPSCRYLAQDIPKNALEGLKSGIPPSQFIVDEIEKASKTEIYPQANTKEVLQKIINDPTIKSALCGFVEDVWMDTGEVVEESGMAVTLLGLLLAEAISYMPLPVWEYSREHTRALLEYLARSKWKKTGVAQTHPWVTTEEEREINHYAGIRDEAGGGEDAFLVENS
ncbi:hypothetical protein N7456_006582 [Penicillium angulare]|uniref:Uncharacterized protein n=1 Tax=Penicillium angulare TaxID=116970 RepID=A0A9W9KBS8_9EURO|nr:hypothetical protein N7456_006582 [Penicillium angulare]